MNFGLLFDIDGVIVRGRKVLPFAPEAFRLLVDDKGKFRIPTVFVTNAGNSLRHNKALQLSEWLGIEVNSRKYMFLCKKNHKEDKNCRIYLASFFLHLDSRRSSSDGSFSTSLV